MIKKQVDFDVWVRPFTQTENPKTVLEVIKKGHPFEDGWELLSTEIAQIGGNDIFFAYTFVRYEYVNDTVSTKTK